MVVAGDCNASENSAFGILLANPVVIIVLFALNIYIYIYIDQ